MKSDTLYNEIIKRQEFLNLSQENHRLKKEIDNLR